MFLKNVVLFPKIVQIQKCWVAQHNSIKKKIEKLLTIRNNTQTAVINIAIKRMLKNKVHLLDVSYVSTYIFRSNR